MEGRLGGWKFGVAINFQSIHFVARNGGRNLWKLLFGGDLFLLLERSPLGCSSGDSLATVDEMLC